MDDERFRSIFINEWRKSTWSHTIVRIERAQSLEAVAKYITKGGGDALSPATTTL
jgi:hypothetical protein